MITIREKDILSKLLDGKEHINIAQTYRKNNKFSIITNLIKRDCKLLRIVKTFKPDLMFGSSLEILHLGKILKINSIILDEDDHTDKFTLLDVFIFPFNPVFFVPESCNMGIYNKKTIFYKGYHELAYLYPKRFIPNEKRINHLFKNSNRYFILRFVEHTAYHDFWKKGINKEIAQNIIRILKPHGNIFINSEGGLEPQFEQYRLQINPLDIHHALYFADMFIGDSQTMAAEAAVLGTPSFRFNDFVGKLGIFEELEHKYNLTFGISTSSTNKLYEKIEELIKIPNIKKEWQRRRQKMLNDKIDVTAFMVWFFENYPESLKIMKENPNYQDRFKNTLM